MAKYLVETYYNLKTKQFWFYYGLILELSPSKAVAMMLSVEDLIAYNEDEIIVKELTQEELIEEGYLS